MAEATEPHTARTPPADPAPPVESVAERLRRLEQAIGGIQDTGILEQHLAERVMARLREQAAVADGAVPHGLTAGDASGISGLVPASLYPAAVAAVAGGFWARLSFFREFRLMVRMYVDPRYRLSRVAQFGVPVVLGLIALNYLFWVQLWSFPLISPLLERIGLVVLAVVLYKLLSREAARYDAVLNYLTRYGR